MADQRLKDLQGTGRRDFLRWSATVAACLGLERSRLLNVINDTAGSAAADVQACAKVRRHMHLADGNGGLANWTQIFPFPKVIASDNAQYAHYALGRGIASTGYDKEWTHAPDSPFRTPTAKWKMTAFLCGNNETHTQTPTSTMNAGANSLLASAAAIQQANPTLLPVLSVGGTTFGAAPGAPAVANVGNAANLIDLFNSAASRALLSAPENGALSEAYYKAFLGLNAAAGRSTVAKQYGVGKVSMNLLSKNLSLQLTPTAADEALFGITGTTPGAVTAMSRSMITSVKAMSLGLTSMLVVTGFRNDPHGIFAGGDAQAMTAAQAMGRMLDGLYELTKARPDPSCSTKSLADQLVFSIGGDTFKNPFNRGGWPDGTPMNTNVLYVMGNGLLKTGWFGDMGPNNAVLGWTPETGVTEGTYQGRGGPLAQSAIAATLYAISGGDMAAVRDKVNAPIGGVINNVATTGG